MNKFQPLCQPQTTPSEQQIFDHLKCEVLVSLRQSLTKSLIPDRHMDFLRSKHVLSEEDCEEICYPPSRQKRASKFMDILEKKGAEAFDALCAALREEGTQTFLLRQLNEDLERRQRLYRELVGQQTQPQGLPPISPPPLQPSPPPSRLHNGTVIQPAERTFQQFTTPSRAESCPGYVSPSSNGNFSLKLDRWKEEREEDVSLRKPSVNVSEYLQNLTIRSEESANDAVMAPTQESGSADLSSEVTCDQQLPTFLSNAATNGSVEGSQSKSLSQASCGPAQDFKAAQMSGDGAVSRRHQHQRLSSRGSLQEMCISTSPVERTGTGLSLSSVSRSEPVENEEMVSEQDSLQEGSFFQSLENQSLVPSSSSSETCFSCAPILCDAALKDQQYALGKCAYSSDKEEKNKKAGNNGNNHFDLDLSLTVQKDVVNVPGHHSELLCLSRAHLTNLKTVNCASSSSELSQPCGTENCDQLSAVIQSDRSLKDGEKEVSNNSDGPFQCEEDKSEHDPHSSQC